MSGEATLAGMSSSGTFYRSIVFSIVLCTLEAYAHYIVPFEDLLEDIANL